MLSDTNSSNTQAPTMADLPQIKADVVALRGLLDKNLVVLQAIEVRIAYLEHSSRGLAGYETVERKRQNA